ncbi:MAG: pantetheine-phosphate adenylyltransferase [Candidatus Gastranaerophilales bacterium]|nr:pantetheine-phosphate adenylyltransferase [Candidatus Gastranaerophilales bacterium]
MKTAIYPGSFDPITKGHLDVLKRAADIFDKVIIVVSVNVNKKSFLPLEDKLSLIKASCKDIKNIEIDSYDGLTIEYAKKKNANVLIRGLRAVSDFEYEMQLSQANSALCSDIHTVFLITKPKYNFISSGTVREIALMQGNVSKFVPEPVAKYLELKYTKG